MWSHVQLIFGRVVAARMPAVRIASVTAGLGRLLVAHKVSKVEVVPEEEEERYDNKFQASRFTLHMAVHGNATWSRKRVLTREMNDSDTKVILGVH